MNNDNQLVFYCEDNRECRVHCDICDSLCFERLYKNHLKSQNHINNNRKRENSMIFISTLTEPKQWSKHQLKLTLTVYIMKKQF